MTALVRTRLVQSAAFVSGTTSKWWLRREGDQSGKPFVDLGEFCSAHKALDVEVALMPGRYTLGAGKNDEPDRIRVRITVPSNFKATACAEEGCERKVPFQPGASAEDASRCKEHLAPPRQRPTAIPFGQTPPRRPR